MEAEETNIQEATGSQTLLRWKGKGGGHHYDSLRLVPKQALGFPTNALPPLQQLARYMPFVWAFWKSLLLKGRVGRQKRYVERGK